MTTAAGYAALAARAARGWAAGTGGSGAGTNGWLLTPAAAGSNGVVFRAERDGKVCAVKVSPVDERCRGAREHDALCCSVTTARTWHPTRSHWWTGPTGCRSPCWSVPGWTAGRPASCRATPDDVHPAAFGRRPERLEMVDRHARGLGDPGAAARSWSRIRLPTVLWVAISRAEARRPRPRLAGTSRFPAAALAEQADRYAELARTLLGRH